MLDLKGLDGFFLRNNGVERGAELGNVPLSVADFIQLPPDCMLRRDCECVAEGAVRKADGQIGLEHEDAFADRLNEIHRVDVTHIAHGRGSRTPSDRGTHRRQQEYDLAKELMAASHQCCRLARLRGIVGNAHYRVSLFYAYVLGR